VCLLTRNGFDWTEKLPAIAKAISQLPVQSAMLDGELIGSGEDGNASFSGLQAILRTGQNEMLTFCAFDLLHLDGWDLRPCQLLERKRLLRDITAWKAPPCYSEHYTSEAQAVWRGACRMGLEGIICKQVDAPYRAGRGSSWVKVKCGQREEFLILGWTPPRGSREGIGALHIGYHDPGGRLHYAGGVGTGFTEAELTGFRTLLDSMETSPPAGMLYAGDPIDPMVRWVRPEIVVDIRFTAWSAAGRLRHPVYLGIRDDKAAHDVVLPIAASEPEREIAKPSGPARRSGRYVRS
jgi:bifunctional non-homologous end joining protein LigD